MRIERVGGAVLYLADCHDVLPFLPQVDGVLTDPPYGWTYPGCAGPSVDPTPFLGYPEAILWAGEPGRQPDGWGTILCGPWHAWAKGFFAWWRCPSYPPVDKRLHPHEKPVELFSRCIENLKGQTILDPFMGSGSTGVAAVKAGRKFIGIEINEGYFDIACKRIAAAC